MLIDLHLKNVDPKMALTIQLSMVEKAIDNAILHCEHDITIIHGVGEGVLKKEVISILKKHPHIGAIKEEYGKTKATLK